MDLLNTLFSGMLSAIQGTTVTLTRYGLPILGAVALIQWYWSGGLELMQGGGVADALGAMLARVLILGIYYWIVVNWTEILTAVLETFLAFTQAEHAHALLTQPGEVWAMGQKIMAGIGKYDTFWQTQAATWSFVVSPRDGILFLLGTGCFLFLTLEMGALLLEASLAMGLGAVLFPWSLLRPLGHLGEFALGWFAGACVRALVMTVLMALAVPLFTTIAPTASQPAAMFVDPMSGVSFPTSAPSMAETFGTVAGALLFAFACLKIPARAARMMAGPALALTGSDLVGAAMTSARFVLASTHVVRGTSQLLRNI